MSTDNLNIDAILELSPQDAGEFCDQHLSVESLASGMTDMAPFTRKGLCEFLGIGESTLSGWLKDGRIPQMAKNSIVLLQTQQMLGDELRRLRNERSEERAKSLRVVGAGDHYQVCEFEEDEEGDITGRVVADHIAKIEDARVLASGYKALRLLRETAPALEYVFEYSENQDFINSMKSTQRRLASHERYLANYDAWKEEYGKKSSMERFMELLDAGREGEES